MNDRAIAQLLYDIHSLKADIELLGNAFSKMSEALNEQTKLVEHHGQLLHTLRQRETAHETISDGGNTFVPPEVQTWLSRHDMQAITKADWIRWQCDKEELKKLREQRDGLAAWARELVK